MCILAMLVLWCWVCCGVVVLWVQVMDWMLEDGQVICVTGSIPQLGMWQPDQMLLLTGETNQHTDWHRAVTVAGRY